MSTKLHDVENDYEIVSVEPSDSPGGTIGTGWCCYVIEQGKNKIHGYKRGDVKSVTRAVEEMVTRLNERRYGKSGRVHLTMSPPARKARDR